MMGVYVSTNGILPMVALAREKQVKMVFAPLLTRCNGGFAGRRG